MSPVRRAMGAPRLNPPSARMIALDAQAEPLQAELEHLRGARCVGIFPPATPRVRELRRELARIDAEHTDEFNRNNPEWSRYWGRA